MKNRIVSAIDIGTSGVKLMSARTSPDGFEVLATCTAPVLGVRRGVVDKVEPVTEAVIRVVREAELQLNKKLEYVFVNINGSHLFCHPARGVVSVSRADRRISVEDVERAKQQAQTVPLSNNKEVIEVVPREYIIDGESGLRQAVDMQGTRLEVEVLLLGGFSGYIKNASQPILSANLQVDDQIFSPIASARAVLSPQEEELGVVMLDIGAGTTSMIVYHEGTLVHLAVFPIGSDDITKDLAIGLQTDMETAEKVKIEIYGQKKKKMEGVKFTEKELQKIVEARLKDIFNQVTEELKKINLFGRLPGGVVLTGGGSQLTGLVDLTKKHIKLPVRRIENEPHLSVLKGMILDGLTEERSSGRPALGWLKKFFSVFIP